MAKCNVKHVMLILIVWHFNQIAEMWWKAALLMMSTIYSEKTTDLQQVTD
jgi:hypothetical protein